MSSNAQVTVKSRYARCPIASPNAKYSQSANTVITAVATATAAVDANSTNPTTTGINTSAVATRFQVMQTVLTGRLPTPSQIESGFPTELYRMGADRNSTPCHSEDIRQGCPKNLNFNNFLHVMCALPRRHLRRVNPAISPLSPLKIHQRLQQPRPIKIRPQRLRHKNLRIRNLPQQEIAHPHLPARPDQQIRVRQIRRIKVPRKLLLRNRRTSVPISLRQDRVHR